MLFCGKPALKHSGDTIMISLYAEHNRCDLIIMATHGRAGLSRWVRSSVAGKILRGSVMPVMMMKSPGAPPVV